LFSVLSPQTLNITAVATITKLMAGIMIKVNEAMALPKPIAV